MPSASVKSDSNGSQETKDPLGKLCLLMEKKIRNLEKRKTKLENYKEELNNGKELNEDQQRAVDAYDAVIASLDLCREFETQILGVIEDNNKHAKQQLKKQQEERAHLEFERLKQVLKVQDVLTRLGQEDIRADFLAGTNGAIQLGEDKLLHLDEIYKLVTPPCGPERETTATGFKSQISTAAENLINLLDGKNKPAVGGITYRDMRAIIYQIANCTYPKVSKSIEVSSSSSPVQEVEVTKVTTKSKKNKGKNQLPNGTATTEVSSKTSKTSSRPAVTPTSALPSQDLTVPSLPPSNPSISSVPSINKMTRVENNIVERPPPGIAAHTVSAVIPSSRLATQEIIPITPVAPGLPQAAVVPVLTHTQTFYSQSQVQPNQPQTMNLDISELVTTGSFNFLQESQVGSEQAAVYIDPAVVSFGSIKPESLVQMHEQQKLSQGVPQNVRPNLNNSTDMSHVTNIPSESYINQSYSSSGVTDYSQSVPSYSSNAVVGPTNIPPPIPLPQQVQEKPNYGQAERINESWADASNIAASQDDDGWGLADAASPANGDNENSWGNPDPNEPISWCDESEGKNINQDADGDRRTSFRGSRGGSRGRGSGGGGGYRGRGGNGYGYQSGGGRGGSANYGNNGYRGNRGGSSNGTGFRGGRGSFSRGGSGGGGGANTRGGYRGRGNYQGNQRNQFQSQ